MSEEHMSETDASVAETHGEKSRAELAAEVEKLRDEVQHLKRESVSKVVVNHLLAELTGSHDAIEDYTADPMANKEFAGDFASRIERHGRTISKIDDRLESLGDITDGHSSRTEKVEAIKQKAKNLAESDTETVELSARDIKGAAGCSRRHAYTLMDEEEGLPADHEWAEQQPEKYVQRGSAERGTLQKKKIQNQALLVDVGQLPGGPE